MTVWVAASACRTVPTSVMDVGAVMDYLACLWILTWGAWVRRSFACFAFWSPVQQEFDIASFVSPVWWKRLLMKFLSFILLWVSMRILWQWESSWTRKVASVCSTGQGCSSHSMWAQTAVMRFMEIFTHSGSFPYSSVHISVEIKKIVFFRANLRCISSSCLWVKRK